MRRMTQAERGDAQRRRAAVRLYRAGMPVTTIAQKLKQSIRWVYQWIQYHTRHPWTRFRSASRAPHHHPTQTPEVVERRVLRLRRQLVRHRPRSLRFAGIGARTIQREYRKRYGTAPSLSTIQRILDHHHLVVHARRPRAPYRPHPAAEVPNAVQATDIITRWIYGGSVVQTFNTVDIYSNEIESAPNVGNDETARYIEGVVSRGEDLLILVDLNKLLSEDEWSDMSGF